MIKENETAYEMILERYNKNPNELNEVLWLYMRSVIMGLTSHTQLYLDEIENILGINTHEEILKVIMRN